MSLFSEKILYGTDEERKAVSGLWVERSTVNQAMLMLAAQPGALFIGQNVCYDGAWPYQTLDGVPSEQRIEFPVAEELQLGVSTGLALQGFLPVSCFPRIDFLLRAADQLINHLDKLEQMSCGQFKPKVIIRTRVGPKQPLDAGPQHTQDHVQAFKVMLGNVDVLRIVDIDSVMSMYELALRNRRSIIVVEAF
jgi:pyruvate/2-oxoglutarate/acetoin dehydrogenase E1 component